MYIMGNKSIESIRISIIIPCYNASAYSMQLSDCIDKQLLVDSQSEMEFILVNDGSNDDTLERLLSIKEKHPFQVSIINQPNMGVSAARNAGIEGFQSGGTAGSARGHCRSHRLRKNHLYQPSHAVL